MELIAPMPQKRKRKSAMAAKAVHYRKSKQMFAECKQMYAECKQMYADRFQNAGKNRVQREKCKQKLGSTEKM